MADYPAPRSILELAAALLDLAADEFGNHVCNDCRLAEQLPDGPAELLARTYDVYNLGSEERRAAEPDQAHTADEIRRGHDFVLMAACSQVLRKMATGEIPS